MCIGGSPRAPAPAPVLPEAPRPPDVSTGATQEDRDRRRRAGAGRAATILTGPLGVQDGAATGAKTLLGS